MTQPKKATSEKEMKRSSKPEVHVVSSESASKESGQSTQEYKSSGAEEDDIQQTIDEIFGNSDEDENDKQGEEIQHNLFHLKMFIKLQVQSNGHK